MHRHQISPILKIVLSSFIILMLIRMTLYYFYKDDFCNLTAYEFLYSIFMGFRVDMITLFTFSSIFILLLLFLKGTKKRAFVGILWALVLNMIFILSFSDVLYYDYTHRHLSSEVFNLGNDIDIITGMAFGSMLPYTIGAIIFSLIFLYFVLKTLTKDIKNFIDGKHIAIVTLMTILILFMGIRNTFNGKAFGTCDAYAVNKVSSGNLALNGFFTIYRTANETQKHNLIKLDEAIKTTQDAMSSTKTEYSDKNYPLMKSYKKQQDKKPYNIVIVLIESFGAEHLDGFTKYTELGVTPYFKKLSNEGLKFTNFYANGQRSIYGVTSVFTGITIPKGFDYLGKGLELSALSYLGSVAKQNGYSTISMQAGNRRSYKIDSISNLAGFDEYYGAEDMPNVEEVEAGRSPATGTYDYNMLDFYRNKLNSMKEPFLGFAFTATTHDDYHLPNSRYEKYPHDLKNYNGSLNAYYYADESIRRFMQKAEKEPWFDRTIFIFTADHGRHNGLNSISKKYRPNDKQLDSIERFRIPLIIYAPKILKPKEIKTLGSQNDIFPSIVDMLGWEADITTMGSSLFDESVKTRFAYFSVGNLIGLLTDDGYIKYNFKDVVAKTVHKNKLEETKKLLFSIDTAEANLIKQNRWTK